MENQLPQADQDRTILIELTAEVVSAYVGNNPVSLNDLPNLIADVHVALGSANVGASGPTGEKNKNRPFFSQKIHPSRIFDLFRRREKIQVFETSHSHSL